jgi:uncharacterized repeat protein (TIGR03803 family)
VFELDPSSGHLTVLHSFELTGSDGLYPAASLLMDSARNLYGTTVYGGEASSIYSNIGFGTVFKLDASGNETVLHSFLYSPIDSIFDGAFIPAALVRDTAGNFYGTSSQGGTDDYGTVFKLDASGNETVLHSFTNGGLDGANPHAGLVLDAAGNFLYGTTYGAGLTNQGTVFKIDTAGNETLLYSFTGGGDGGQPEAGLIMDTAGNLYGTTSTGGAYGYGTVFKLDTAGNETVLHSFANSGGDGATPVAGLVMDPAGNLYGTTEDGGAYGYGTVFKLVITSQTRIADLQNMVNSLVSAGTLNAGQGQSLLAILDAALAQINGENTAAAVQQLEAFIKHVQALVNGQVLTAEQGQALIDAANSTITALGA